MDTIERAILLLPVSSLAAKYVYNFTDCCGFCTKFRKTK